MIKTTKNNKVSCLGGFLDRLNLLPPLFFVGLWIFLSTYESALLFRINELSVFLFDDLFFEGLMSKPAGLLHYVSSFLVQFFYYPALGAAIYVALLYVVYRLVVNVFELPRGYKLLAMLPVLALLASNTQLGYWIFYLKQPGYWYMALLATLLFLLALWCFKRMNVVLRIIFVVALCFVGYPLLGAYALAMVLLIGVYYVAEVIANGKKIVLPLVMLAVVACVVYIVPQFFYKCYTSICEEYLYGAGLPITQWVKSYVAKAEHDTWSYWYNTFTYWIPFLLLLVSFVGLCVIVALRAKLPTGKKTEYIVTASVALYAVLLLWIFWYNDTNFRIENKQNNAMWNCKWRDVAEYARGTDKPTRQIVINKNIALFKLGVAGNEMFSYPDGSKDIIAPMPVHLTQTGGKMVYFHYGKFNFSYRWCMEDAVEYGWKIEYLKHAVRSMLLSGEYRLAQRYIDILKRTMFYRGWAKDMEAYIANPELIEKTNDFNMPLQLACCPDNLGVDESFVEAYLTNEFKYVPQGATPLYIEVALAMSLVRKDQQTFWYIFDRYLKEINPVRLPKCYQEALLMFLNIDKGKTVNVSPDFIDRYVSKSVQRRLENFVSKTKKYKGMKEAEMAQYFTDEYGDTYFYFYFFVRKIRTN